MDVITTVNLLNIENKLSISLIVRTNWFHISKFDHDLVQMCRAFNNGLDKSIAYIPEFDTVQPRITLDDATDIHGPEFN